MTGKYSIEVYNNRVHYFLTVQRNITLIQGDSATGKTELIRMIQEHEANGRSSGITVVCEKNCTVLGPVDWELRLTAMNGQVVFIDETAGFIKSKRFAELVRGSDNYFVLVSRDGLSNLPYSVKEIYGLRNVSDTQRYKTYHHVYNEMYHLYHLDTLSVSTIGEVITEDSNSGYDCFSAIYPGRCISASGKSNVYDLIFENKNKALLVIVDGAAFGAEIGKVIRYLETSDVECTVFAPESFEFLLLNADLIDVPKTILQETFLYADSTQYMSWEEFYTDYLSEITRNTVYQYGKSKLPEIYKTSGTLKKIVMTLPKPIRPDFDS